MMRKIICYLLFPVACVSSCKTSKQAFNPDKKYAPEQLKEDYRVFRNVLQESHPSLYWYTSKDSLDHYFDDGYARIRDSMTEAAFRVLLSYVITRIDCGHTAIKYSKEYAKYLDTARFKTFPLGLKFWADTMVVTVNLNREDSILRRGTIIKSINGWTQPQLRDSLFKYVVTDGYSITGKYQSLSTGFTFANLYKNVFGMPERSVVRYIDSMGEEQQTELPLYDVKSDTLHKGERHGKAHFPQLIFFSPRSLQLDTTAGTGYMTVNTFDRGNHLKKFFRRSFEGLRENHIHNLVIDVRSNGGGDAGNSTLLTRYLIDKKFKLADSLYAVSRTSNYNKYISKSFLYHMLMLVVTSKKSDGKYHFGYFERHYFSPKTKNHFDGQVYILIGGNSFSATTLFAGALKGQKNVTLVGEETGGGYYGNTAWVIPDVTLPNTKVRFRLPKFRLVVDHNREKNGRGVMPDVPALPTVYAIQKGIDFKAETARLLIEANARQSK
ncbi:MAG TPA: S41 family peptidase [Puia sp.]|nr:S41 family peptidase [Puia sp.]